MGLKQLVSTFVLITGVGLGMGIGEGLVAGGKLPVAWAQEEGIDRVSASAVAEDEAVIQAVRDTMPAVVSLSHGDDDGSGFLVSSNGTILTNAHVVEGTSRVDVKLTDGRTLQGRVLTADQNHDLAVVKIPGNGYPTARLGNSDRVEVGQTAIAIGNPMGLERTVTRGVVSGIDRKPEDIDLDHLLQTDAAINPGNSGGPLLDLHGRVIGINSAALHGRRVSGLNFAIPINAAREMIRE